MSKPCANSEFKCDGVLGDNSEHDYCYKCRAHDKRWAKRSSGDVRKRYQYLNIWEHRISTHPKLREERSAKVVHLDARRKRA